MNLASVIEGHEATAPALLVGADVTTYGALRAQVAALRQRCGLSVGDRVGLVCGNDASFVVAYLAVLAAGAVAVPLNPHSPGPELARQLAHVGSNTVLVGPGVVFDPATLGVRVEAVGPDDAGGPGSARAPGVVGGLPPPVERGADDLAVLLFTAGTAGPPKAAMLTHANLLANLDQVQAVPGRAVRASDVMLGVLPVHHIFGLNMVLGLALRAGACVVLVDHFDPAATLATIAAAEVTVVAGVPPMFQAWLALAGDGPAGVAGWGGVRLAVSGAAPLGAVTAAAFEARFGMAISEGYGLTEASPAVTSSVAGGRTKPGSIGVPLPGLELRLVDSDGRDALAADAGEIWVRGPNVFVGYWDDPLATAAVLAPGGWLRTGDVAVVDDEGWLFIVDRVKDVIIVSGFNVYPAEVEDVLAGHPAVLDVAVVGVPQARTGEAVKAFVVVRPGRSVTAAELVAHAASQLARYKCPAEVSFVEMLPRGVTGKLLRRSLRTPAPGPTGPAVGPAVG